MVLIPALLMAIGAAFLVLSVVPIYGSQPPSAGDGPGFEPLSDEQLTATNPIRPQNAASTPAQKPASAAPEPVIARTSRPEPIPVDALPVTNAQPVSGTFLPPPVKKTKGEDGPLEVAIVSHLSDAGLVSQLKADLERGGSLNVHEAEPGSLGRPDVLLILDHSTVGSSVWFCGPSPNESSLLASAVLSQIGDWDQEPDDAVGDAVDQSLGCSTLLAGRARMAALDLRLPAAGVSAESLASPLAAGVHAYLSEGEARIRQQRGSDVIVWPAYGPITSHYGPSHPLGIDIGQSTGDIVAATDGTVTFAGGDPCCSYGLYVVIESPDGITTLYGHLSKIYVKEGQNVSAGQPLGPVGSTGHSTGPHLHFETLVDGERVNPLSLLP